LKNLVQKEIQDTIGVRLEQWYREHVLQVAADGTGAEGRPYCSLQLPEMRWYWGRCWSLPPSN